MNTHTELGPVSGDSVAIIRRAIGNPPAARLWAKVELTADFTPFLPGYTPNVARAWGLACRNNGRAITRAAR